MSIRDHQPIILSQFNGLWKRGTPENTPLDHFQDCNNIKFSAGNSFSTRDGVGISQNVGVPLSNVKRIYNFPTPAGNTLIVLTNIGSHGDIYHVINATTVYGPILSIDGMTDFAFFPYAGRGYITPFTSYIVGGLSVEKGLPGEFLYVYAGDGTPARRAAGEPLSGTLTIANGNPGHTDAGFHLFGIVGETASGFLTAPGAITSFTTISTNSVSFGNVPVGQTTVNYQGAFVPPPAIFDDSDDYIEESIFLQPPNQIFLADEEYAGDDLPASTYPYSYTTLINNPYIIKRHLVATKIITGYNGDPQAYQFFFVPNAVINNNSDTFLNNISFFDADLLADASHLFNNYSTIPAGAVLSSYHNRLALFTTYTDISIGLVSSPGEPEAISQTVGIIVVPLDGNPITNAQELRDVFYVTKRAKTVSFTDNNGNPSTWVEAPIDNALGTCVHGIGTVLDSGATNVDFLLVATFQGLSLFNGKYVTTELTWKIEDLWRGLNRNNFAKIQVLNAPIQKEIYIILPDNRLLVGNYSLGMDSKSIRWAIWTYAMNINTIAVWNISDIIIGANM